MAIAVMYHHDDRGPVEGFCRPLELEGYEFKFAPLGMEVGSQEWKRIVESDLYRADSFLFFVTAKSVLDKMVAWRVRVAMEKISEKRPFIPILLDSELPPRATWLLRQILVLQMVDATNVETFRYAREEIKKWLPKPRRPMICFISYARDDASVATRLKADLEGRGIRAWRDLDDIPAGASWDDTIAKAIAECSHFLLLVTPTSVQSSNVSDEVSYARERRKAILPLIIKDAPLPFRIHRAQAIDFTKDYQTGFQVLIGQLK